MYIERVHPVVTLPTVTFSSHISQEWRESLALLAQERAGSCRLDAAPPEQSLGEHVGWNVQQVPHGEASFSEVIDAWFLEGRDYLYLNGQCRENSTCQHYTQVHEASIK